MSSGCAPYAHAGVACASETDTNILPFCVSTAGSRRSLHATKSKDLIMLDFLVFHSKLKRTVPVEQKCQVYCQEGLNTAAA